jgi:hypothetical protein
MRMCRFPATVRLAGGCTARMAKYREGRAEGSVALDPLPLGRHHLHVGNDVATLLVAPERLAEAPRGWGVMAPLYGLKPEAGGGLGSYARSRPRRRGAGSLGAFPRHQSGSCRLSRTTRKTSAPTRRRAAGT